MSNIRKIIIAVDDNADNLLALKNTLKDVYEVYPCPSAQKMFDLLGHVQPDLILLDVEMPETDGYEAAKKIKNDDNFKEIPIIFLTARNDAKSEIEGLQLGAVDYIHKPFVAPLLHLRIKTHLALVDHQIEARNASRAKSEFLSHMSHEIRSPLNAVMGLINMALHSDDIQKIKHCMERADGASKHLLNIINNILDLSKIEANKLELSYNEFNVEKMLQDITNVTNVRAEEKKLDFSVTIDKNVPPFIISDELRLSQVITNLISNAIKFTPENGAVALSVEKIGEANDEITLRTEVSDSGIGITEEQQKRLFTSYNQADSSIAKNFGGTGLGLTISKQIVELMQGKIWIESQHGIGSKFIFTIKAKKGIRNTNAPSDAGAGRKTGYDFRAYTILAAEDVDINREILSAILEETGISIDFAEDGQQAVSMFQAKPEYDLILMDVNMPEMDGFEATRAIRKLSLPRAKDICIIAMTANVFKEDIEKCISAGMNDHIGKPVSMDGLNEILQKHLPPKK